MGTLPVLPVADVPAAIDYYVEAFGFQEDFRFPDASGTIANGQVSFGDNQIMFNLNAKDAGKSGGGIWLWLRDDDGDIDALYEKMRTKAAAVKEEIGDRFWGDRSFAVEDAFGYTLAFNKRISDQG